MDAVDEEPENAHSLDDQADGVDGTTRTTQTGGGGESANAASPKGTAQSRMIWFRRVPTETIAMGAPVSSSIRSR